MPTTQNDHTWHFPGRITRVVDGDTLDFTADLGFHIRKGDRLRVRDVDTGEIFGVPKDSEEYQRGQEHKQFVEEWLAEHTSDGEHWPFVLATEKEIGVYGRWTGDVRPREGGQWLSEALLEEYPDVESSRD